MSALQHSTCAFCGANFTKSRAKFCGKCGKPRNMESNVQTTNQLHKETQFCTSKEAKVDHKNATDDNNNNIDICKEKDELYAEQAKNSNTCTSTDTRELHNSSTNTKVTSPVNNNVILATSTVTATKESGEVQNWSKMKNFGESTKNDNSTSSSNNNNNSSCNLFNSNLTTNNNELCIDYNNQTCIEETVDDTNPFNSIKDSVALRVITPHMLETTNADELRSWRRGNLMGKGSSGSVYLGLLPSTGTFCAVKCVELGSCNGYGNMYSDNSEISMRELVSLSREINLLRSLSHPNLCSFYGVYYDAINSSINIFMEYISGGALTSIIRKFMPLPAHLIRIWTIQLLRGLAYLHSQKIIHRDIKGDNILIDITSSTPSVCSINNNNNNNNNISNIISSCKTSIPENQVKLVDFGAARKLSDKFAQSRTVIGTPYWMAPEVVLSGASLDEPYEEAAESHKSEPQDKEKNIEGNTSSSNQGGYSYKADVWSVGCTVAEMHTGKPPWPVCANATAAILMIAQCGSSQPLFESKRSCQAQELTNAAPQESSLSSQEQKEEPKSEKSHILEKLSEKHEQNVISTKGANGETSNSSSNVNGKTKKLRRGRLTRSTSTSQNGKSSKLNEGKANADINANKNNNKKKSSDDNHHDVCKLISDESGVNHSGSISSGGGGLSSSNTTSTNPFSKVNTITSMHGLSKLELPLHLATPGCASFMQQCCTVNPSLRPSVEDLLQHP